MNWFKELRKALTPPTPEEREVAERFNRLTLRACQALRLARDEAVRLGNSYVGTEHMLLGLIGLGQGVAANVLEKANCDLKAVRSFIEKQIGQGTEQKAADSITLNPGAKKNNRGCQSRSQGHGPQIHRHRTPSARFAP